jgi:HSP20 family protein
MAHGQEFLRNPWHFNLRGAGAECARAPGRSAFRGRPSDAEEPTMPEKSSENPQAARGSQSQSQSSATAAQQASTKPPAQAGQGTQSTERAREQQPGRGSGVLQRRSALPFAGTFAQSPFSLVRRMMEDFDRVFEEFGFGRGLGGGLPVAGARGALERGGLAMDWSPAVEMFERDGQLVIRADLPGLSPDDVRLEITDEGSLAIQGERRSEMEAEEEGGVYRSERTYGRFSRVIALPEGVDADRAQARFDNGVLEISLPLPQQSQRRRIQIQGQGQGASGSAQEGSSRTGPVH